MRCYTCSSDIDASMRHAISINSCPFCGRHIFSEQEYEFRKSIHRALIKNGLEDEQMMVGIVDDITTILGEQFTRDRELPRPSEDEEKPVARKVPPGGQVVKSGKDTFVKKPAFGVMEIMGGEEGPKKPQRRVASQEELEEAMAAEEELADDPEFAPARQLAPDPRRANQTTKPMTHADKVALAMREFEASQRIDDDNITHAQDIPDEDEDDGQEIFTIDRAPSAEVERRRKLAEERIRQVQEKSGFKNQPIQRRPK